MTDEEIENPSPTEWKKWLENNFKTSSCVWLVFYKKPTKKWRITLNEAVEEALCVGWIDGKLQRIDDKRYRLRFSPRRKGSYWSDSNVKRMRNLIKAGRMKDVGRKKIPEEDLSRKFINMRKLNINQRRFSFLD